MDTFGILKHLEELSLETFGQGGQESLIPSHIVTSASRRSLSSPNNVSTHVWRPVCYSTLSLYQTLIYVSPSQITALCSTDLTTQTLLPEPELAIPSPILQILPWTLSLHEWHFCLSTWQSTRETWISSQDYLSFCLPCSINHKFISIDKEIYLMWICPLICLPEICLPNDQYA